MTKYFYTSTNNKGKVKGKVYKLFKNDLVYICDYDYITASCRGNIHEVFNALMDCREIPKKYYKSSESDWSGGGYFDGIVKEKYSIKEV